MRRSGSALAIAVLLGYAGLTGAPAPSTAASLAPDPVWLPPAPVSASDGGVAEPQLVVGTGGVASAVWLDATDGTAQVLASSRAPGDAAWSLPVPVSDPSTTASDLHVGVGPGARVTAVWLADGATEPVVLAAVATDGRSWRSPVPLSTVGDAVSEPDLDVSPSGETAVIWRRDPDAGDLEIELRRREPDSLAWWSGGVTVSRTQVPFEPQVSINDLGEATVVWHNSGGLGERLLVRTFYSRWAGGPPAVDAAPGGVPGRFELDSGTWATHLVYEWVTPAGTEIHRRYRVAGYTAFEGGGLLSAPGTDSSEPHAVVVGGHALVAAWVESDGSTARLLTVVTAPGGTAGATDLGPVVPGSPLTLAGHGDPVRAVAVWSSPGGADPDPLVAGSYRSGGWTVDAVAAEGGEPVGAVDHFGNALVGWLAPDGSPDRLHARTLDAPGQISQLRLPVLPTGRRPVATLRWALSDWAPGIAAAQQLRVRQVGRSLGRWVRQPLPEPPATRTRLGEEPGSTYCVQVRATDASGGVGAWSPERCTTFPLDDRAGSGRGWDRRTPATAYQATTSVSTRRGARLTFTDQWFHSLFLLATTSPRAGEVDVLVDGRTVATIDLHSPSTRRRVLLPVVAMSARWEELFDAHTVQIVARSRTPVTIDGIVTQRFPAEGWQGGD